MRRTRWPARGDKAPRDAHNCAVFMLAGLASRLSARIIASKIHANIGRVVVLAVRAGSRGVRSLVVGPALEGPEGAVTLV